METKGPATPVEATLPPTAYISTAADHVDPLMEAVRPDGCGFFRLATKFRNCDSMWSDLI